MNIRLRALPSIAVMAIVLATSSASAQDTSLRDRLRERLAERSPRTVASAVERSGPARIEKPGDYRDALDHDGLSRQFLIHVPRSYDPARPTPVVMAFHGGGGNMQFQADDANYGLIGKSESAGCIAVFPNGYSPFPGGRLATWNAGTCCASARDKNIDDVGFVRELVANLGRRLNVDARRIYAAGMSNGGMLTHRLACEAADLFAAIAAVAGTDNTRSCTPSRPVSVLEIHALDDDHVLFQGGAGAAAFRDATKVTEFNSVPQTVAHWVSRNGCSATPTRVLERPGAYCERHGACREGVEVQWCVTETGGHSWPGAGRVRGGKQAASQAISADDVMWDFFLRH